MLKRFSPRLMPVTGILISAAAVLWLVAIYDWRGALDAARDARIAFILPAPVILLANFILRAMRWRGLFPPAMRPRPWNTFSAMMAGCMFNILSPARAGDLVRIHLIGRREQLPRSAALGTVVVERTLDLIVLLALLAFVLLSQPLPEWAAHAGKVVAALACTASLAIVVLGSAGERLIAALLPLLAFLPPGLVQRLDVSGRVFIQSLSAFLNISSVLLFIVLTAAIWLLDTLFVYVIALSFALPLGFADVIFVMVAITVGTMVPASPGYVGTYEFFGLSALDMLAFHGAQALGFVIVLHATYLLGSCLIGGACAAWDGWPRLPAPDEQKAQEPAEAK